MNSSWLRAYKNYRWIVSDPAMLGGKPAIRGTRLSASLILACLAEGMSAEEIEESYGPFPHEAIPEILKAAAELLDSPVPIKNSMFSQVCLCSPRCAY